MLRAMMHVSLLGYRPKMVKMPIAVLCWTVRQWKKKDGRCYELLGGVKELQLYMPSLKPT